MTRNILLLIRVQDSLIDQQPPKLLSDGSRPRKRPRVAMGKGMKGLRGYVKPQDTPFAPGYTNVHPPVRLAAIGA
jgi:hypothetical protein